MRAVFSRRFKSDLAEQETKYAEVSERLASAFRERLAGQVRQIIRWEGGDHIGPHGFPCRRTRPFPFYLYYVVEEDVIYFLGLVHERRHPTFLEERMRREGRHG